MRHHTCKQIFSAASQTGTVKCSSLDQVTAPGICSHAQLCISVTRAACAGRVSSLHILCKPHACHRVWFALLAPPFIGAGALKFSHCCYRKHSTWSQRDRDLLAQMSQQFVSDISASTRECVYGYMAAMLPDKAKPDIAGHSDWYDCLMIQSSMHNRPIIAQEPASQLVPLLLQWYNCKFNGLGLYGVYAAQLQSGGLQTCCCVQQCHLASGSGRSVC